MHDIRSSRFRFATRHLSLRALGRALSVLIAYLALFNLLDRFSTSFQILPGVVAWYPADGLSFAILLGLGTGYVPVVAIATLLSVVYVYPIASPPLDLVAGALIVAAAYSLAAEILKRRFRVDPRLRSLRDVLGLILASGMASAALAILAVSGEIASGAFPEAARFDATLHWWIGETVGNLTVVPVLLIFIMPKVRQFLGGQAILAPSDLRVHRPGRGIVLKTLIILVILYLAFGVKVLGQFDPLFLLAVPLIWIALKDGIVGASLSFAAVSIGTALALVVFGYDLTDLGTTQLLMLVMGTTSLVTGIIVTERRNTERALKGSEERYRSLYENSTLGLYRTTPDGQIVLANPALIAMLGYSSFEELARRDLEQEGYEPDYPRSRFRSLIENEGVVRGLASKWTKKDGTTIFVRESARAIRDAQGKVSYYEGTVEDVTDRERAELALRDSLERYHHAVDNLLEGCQIIDYDWRYVYVNDAAARQGGRTPAELLMHTMMEIYPGIEDTRLYHTLQRCMDERVIDRMENEFSYPDGTTRWFELSIQPVPEGLFILSNDISDRKKADLARQESERRFRALIENSADAITLLDASGVAVYDSPAAPGMLGYLHGELVGRSAFDLLHPDDLAASQRVFQQVVATPGLRVGSTFRLRHADGSWLWIEGVATNLFADPSVKAIVVNYRNITQRKQAEEKIQRQIESLRALREIDSAITSSFGMDLSLGVVISHVLQQLGVDAASIALFDPISNVLSYVAGRGFRTETFPRAGSFRLGDTYAGRVALERRTVHIPDLTAENDYAKLGSILIDQAFVSYYGVPLITKGRVAGVLEVFHRASLHLDEEGLGFLEALAGQAAIAIDNATLFEKLERSNNELTMAYDATIEGWSHALDLRDKETEGHTQRVTELTVRLARSFGLSEEQLVHVRRGALLHDIGKMGIPDYVLLKPGALTPEEWVVMQQHPQFAYDMLSPIRYLQNALDIPYCHHEKWDGTGYPRGLKGEQIPLEARIFAVVDVWDALTSDRPYRAAWPPEKVLEHIKSLAGTHFDPTVVQTILSSGLIGGGHHPVTAR